jgi:outer membrane protein TolC
MGGFAVNRRLAVLFVACVGLAAAPLSAGFGQEPAEQEGVSLSLAQCLRIALDNNLDLVSARKDPEVSAHNVSVEQARFDITLTAGASRFESEEEITSLSDLNERTSDGASVGIGRTLEFGADYGVTLQAARNELSGPLVGVPASYGANLELSFNVPLLRGFGRTPTTERLQLARGNLEISREELRRRAHATLEAVEGAYWDVVAARQALEVAHRKLRRAKDLLELNRKKVEVGTLAPIEITQAEAGVAANEEDVIVAGTALDNAEDELLRQLAIPQDDPMWDQALRPADKPSFAAVDIDLERAIDEALDRRPEMSSARQDVRNRQLSERSARNAVRPGLDLALSATPAGNNFETQILGPGPDGIPGTFDDDFETLVEGAVAESLSEIPDLENFQWSVGLNFSYPILNRAAKAGYSLAVLNREKAEIGLRNQEQAIRVEVRRAAREVQSGSKRVDAARANVVLQGKKLEAEQKKFENGMSTSFEVLTFQNDLADAELGEIRALVDYNKALAALERAKGTLLEARGLELGP